MQQALQNALGVGVTPSISQREQTLHFSFQRVQGVAFQVVPAERKAQRRRMKTNPDD
jgi:hypothetical protein